MKIISTLLLSFACTAMYGQQAEFNIEGTFSKSMPKGKIHYNYNEQGVNVKDSVPVIDGKFLLKGKVLGIQKAYITFKPDRSANLKQAWRDSKAIFFEPGHFKILATDSISYAKVIGSPINDEYMNFMKPLNQLADTKRPIWGEYIKISLADRKTSPRAAELLKKINEIDARREELLKTYVSNHPSSYFSIEAITELMGPYVKAEKVEKLWAGLDPKLKDSYRGRALNAVLMGSKATDVGSVAPLFSQPDTSGKLVHLKDIKARYVFVDFWASWCHPCRAENPNVLKAYQKFKEKGFTVIGISIDLEKDKQKWINAIHEDGMPWTQLLSPSNVNAGAMKAYGIRAIPANFLIDPNGIIVAKNLHGPELAAKLEEILK